MRLDEPVKARERGESERPWWREEGDIHEYWWTHAHQCVDVGGRREKLWRLHDVRQGLRPVGDGESELKVARNAANAIFAKLARSMPSTWALTDGGSISVQERGRHLTSWLAGIAVRLDSKAKKLEALDDSITFGAGGIHTDVDSGPEGGLLQEVVWVGDCGIEPLEAYHRVVRTLYRVRVMDRRVAMARWPSKKTELENAGFGFGAKDPSLEIVKSAPDMVTLVEMWHLGEAGLPGRHAIVADTATLLNEKWEGRRWPIRWLHHTPDRRRFFGQGLVEAMSCSQELVDKITDKIEASFEKGSPKRLIHTDSGVADEQVTDTPYEIVRWSGEPHMMPQVETAPAISSDYRMVQADHIDRVYQLNGVSQFGASSMKPAGIEAAAALRALNDTEDAYWFPQQDAFEKFCVGVDVDVVTAAEKIADKPGSEHEKLEALAISSNAGRTTLRRIAYKDARFDEDAMILQALPVAQLSRTASGRIQDVREYVELGVPEDKDEVRELLGYPDTRRWESLESAGRRLVQLQVEQAMQGIPQEVDPSAIPLDYAQKHSRQQLALARLEGNDADLDTLQAFVDGVDGEVERLKAEMQAAAAPPMGPPAGPSTEMPPGGPQLVPPPPPG